MAQIRYLLQHHNLIRYTLKTWPEDLFLQRIKNPRAYGRGSKHGALDYLALLPYNSVMSDEHLLFQNIDSKQQSERRKKSIDIRRARPEDAKELMQLIHGLVADGTAYLTDQLEYSVEQQAEYIASGKDSVILVAERNNELVGWINIRRNFFPFRHHSGMIVIGVKQEFQGQGIGGQLLEAIEPMALFIHIERLELGVRAENTRAYTLYTQHGYAEEGRRIGGVKRDGQYSDEILMAKNLR